jgi:membrane protein implicated in regulation of membrane protease activity
MQATMPAMVNTVIMLLTGVLAGLIASAIGIGIAGAIAVGAIAFVLIGVVSLIAADRSFRQMETDLRPRFPSPPTEVG